MLLSMLIAECLSKFRCTFLDTETYYFQLLECSIAAYSTVCMPYRYGTASYNFCLLQVMHRIDLTISDIATVAIFDYTYTHSEHECLL